MEVKKIHNALDRAIKDFESRAINEQCSKISYGGNLSEEGQRYKNREKEVENIRQILLNYEQTYLNEYFNDSNIYDYVSNACDNIIQKLHPLIECIKELDKQQLEKQKNFIDQQKSYINSLTITKQYCNEVVAKENEIRNIPTKAEEIFEETKNTIINSYPFIKSNLQVPDKEHDCSNIAQQYHRWTKDKYIVVVLQNDLYKETYGSLSLEDRLLFNNNQEAAINVINILQHFDKISDIKTRKTQEERIIDSRYFIYLTKWIKDKWNIECHDSTFIKFCNHHYNGKYKIPQSESLSAAKIREKASCITKDNTYKEFDKLVSQYNHNDTDSNINISNCLLAYSSEAIRNIIVH